MEGTGATDICGNTERDALDYNVAGFVMFNCNGIEYEERCALPRK